MHIDKSFSKHTQNIDELLRKDTWLASEIGLEPDVTHSTYHIRFDKIKTEWLRIAAKKFIRFQAATRSFASCRSYVRSISHFDTFLLSVDKPFNSKKINRSHIIGFINHLAKTSLKPASKHSILINLRTFHQIGILEDWLDWPKKPIIYGTDLPKVINAAPKYISNDVVKQLKESLHKLSPWQRNFVVIMMETGRRISEICTLAYDCIEQDGDNDFLLRVHEKKLSQIRLLPISTDCINAIKDQQSLVENNGGSSYLFPSRGMVKGNTISSNAIHNALNRLAVEENIKDNNGKIWIFRSHQFRHTIGTQMINQGVSQVIVQKYLGHSSPEMTSRYAHIHDATMKKAFIQYQEKIIDINGKNKLDDAQMNAKWVKKNIISQSLPNGSCALPITQNRCPHANACLTCSHFRTSKTYLDEHKTQLQQTREVINTAERNGWSRIVEMNSDVACNLEKIINSLENNHE